MASEGLPAGLAAGETRKILQIGKLEDPTVCDNLQGTPRSSAIEQAQVGNRAEVVDSLMRSWQKM